MIIGTKISMLCITIPIFYPIVTAAGINEIWYATVVIISIEMGLITPPVGMNLYATMGVAESDVRLEDIMRGVIPFFVAEVACLLLIFFFPRLSTFLPGFID